MDNLHTRLHHSQQNELDKIRAEFRQSREDFEKHKKSLEENLLQLQMKQAAAIAQQKSVVEKPTEAVTEVVVEQENTEEDLSATITSIASERVRIKYPQRDLYITQ